MHVPTVLAAAMLISAVSAAGACDLSLEGVWASDAKLSMDYNNSKSNLPTKTTEFLSQLLGRLKMKFANGILDETMPDVELMMAGRKYPSSGFHEHVSYTVLFCNSSTVVWKTKLAIADEEDTTTFNFVDPDTAWVYMGSADRKLPDIHGREYFRRVH